MIKTKSKMKKAQTTTIMIVVLLAIIAVGIFYVGYKVTNKSSITGNVVNTNTKQEEVNTPVIACNNQCDYSENVCNGNAIYSCYDNNNDGCKEEVLLNNCADNQICGNGNCIQKDNYKIQVSAIGCMGHMYVGPIRAIQLVVYKNNQAIYNFSDLKFEIYMDEQLVSSGKPYYDRYYATSNGITLFKLFDMRCTQPDISNVRIVLKDKTGNELDSAFGKYTFDGDVSKYLPSDTVCQNGQCSGSQ